MREFEYTLVSQSLIKEIPEETPHRLLNRFGEDGWELAAIDYGCFIFKREITLEMRQDRARLARDRTWRIYARHMLAEHDTQVWIDGDIVGTHRERYPDCAFRLDEVES